MRNKAFLFYLILNIFSTILCINAAFAQDNEIITNNVIIEMVKAKLGETIIINKIKNSKTNFDLSTDNLIKLKNTGVSDSIINAMIESQNPQPRIEHQENGPMASGDVFILQYGKMVEIEYVAGFTKNLTSMWTYGISSRTKFAIMASGEQASMRITDKNPVFYVRTHPSEISLVKFDIDTYNKKVVRYITRAGDLWQTEGKAGQPSASNIDFEFKKEANGLYKITLNKPLDRGEYGIIAPGSGGMGSASASYKIYDFGVDE